MNLMPRLCLVGAIVLASAFPVAAKIDLDRMIPPPEDEPIPIEDFFRPRVLYRPSINPAGTHVAAISSLQDDDMQLLVYDLKTKKSEIVGGSGDREIASVMWVGDKRVMFHLGARKRYGLGLLGGELGDLKNSYPILQYYGASVIAIPPKDRSRPLVWCRFDIDSGNDLGATIINTRNFGNRIVNALDVSTNMSHWQQVRENRNKHVEKSYPVPKPGFTSGYLADREGQLAYAFLTEGGDPWMERLAGKEWIRCPIDLDVVDVIGAADEAGQIVVVAPNGAGKPRALRLMDAATGEPGEILLEDAEYDFTGWLYRRPSDRAVLGAIFDRSGPRSVWFDEKYRALQKMLDDSFPSLVSRIIDSDDAETIFLVETYSDRQPAIYNWVRPGERAAGKFNNSAPWIDPARMRPTNVIKFKTRDGRRLDAYLTLPDGASKENPPPLIVLPHGGPWVRDRWQFDAEAQFLSSRGYAVLKPNYRGSPGYNWMFPSEDEWDFMKMHYDVTDATRAMIASGLVDKDRIAIMGASFGGYLAISGVVNDPDLYRCAITNVGVFDWERMILDAKYDQFDSPQHARLIYKLGDPKKDPGRFDAISPGRRADTIRVPVFVAGGKDDPVVEIAQSRKLVSMLEKGKVPHETYFVREEGHGMRHIEHQVELYGRIEAFLAKHMAPRAGQ
jgi:acetyl esterase/lipase